jgi:hypothetical protein
MEWAQKVRSNSFYLQSLLALVLVLTCTGCASKTFAQSVIPPKTVYKLEQATLTSPNQSDWHLVQHELHALALGKKPEDRNQTTVLSAMMYPAKAANTSRSFLQSIADERAKNDDKKRFKVLNVKNEFVTFKDLPCLKYQTLSEDHQDKGIDSDDFEYFKTSGYVCRYPLEYIAFQLEISHRSKEKEIPPELLKIGEEFFQDVQLVDATIKRLKAIP